MSVRPKGDTPVLALRLAAISNGVSKLHGNVSRRKWSKIWPGVTEAEVPIGHITNGVHFRSWVSCEMNQLYDRYLGPKWREEPADEKPWDRVESIPGPELWGTQERRRERLVSHARQLLRAQLKSRGASKAATNEAEGALNSDALTIGFGRRFAPYKRATLHLRNPERLARILNDPQRPVQIIFAGKAHPQDNRGKQWIQTLIDLAKRPEFRRKLVSSGIKAQANGVLNVSTLDGWWVEAWWIGKASACDVGWAIRSGESYDDPSYQDQVEAEALYELLEREIVPIFYDRGADGIPMKWVARMKTSIAKLCPEFNMHRAVMQYVDEYYLPASRHYVALGGEREAKTKRLAVWLCRRRTAWPQLTIEPAANGLSELGLGDEIRLSARVALGGLAPEDGVAQALIGRVNP